MYITLYRCNKILYSKNNIAEQIVVSNGSLRFRIGNFKAIQKISKTSNFTKLSKEMYDKYNLLSEPELRQLAFS